MIHRFEYSYDIYHSKGPWKEHKYLKKVGNKYFYTKASTSDQYEGSEELDPGKLSEDDYSDYILEQAALNEKYAGKAAMEYKDYQALDENDQAAYDNELNNLNNKYKAKENKRYSPGTAGHKSAEEERINKKRVQHYVSVYGDELYHHGIQGQKWGVRRFQNEDGTLTPEGKIRYSKGSKDGRPEKMVSKCLVYNKENKQRMDEAAKLGLKAMRDNGYFGLDNIDSDNTKWWFLHEDQTIGYGVVADLINQGYTSKQVGDLIDYAEEQVSSDFNKAYIQPYFDLNEGYDLRNFARSCEKVKERENAK